MLIENLVDVLRVDMRLPMAVLNSRKHFKKAPVIRGHPKTGCEAYITILDSGF